MLNRVTELLGVEHPIVQAPMGYIARAQLASAVSNAGALGIIETSSGQLDQVRDEIVKMRDLTEKPFGVNIAQLWVRDASIVDFVHDQGVRFVTTSAGDPHRFTNALHEAGITVFHVVPNLRAALKAIDAGVDGIVAEGGEGGGFKNTRDVASMVLVPLVCSQVDVPVIAAGGICDGRTMAAAFALGAEGVQMGTRMVSAAESPVHDNYKQLIVDSPETGSVMLNRFHKPGFRVLATPYSEAREQTRGAGADGTARRPAVALLRRRPRRLVRVRGSGGGPHRRGEAGGRDHRRDDRRVPRHRADARQALRVVNDRLPALDGLRVLEASEGVAGAYAGKLLRDQGADVVKLERSEGGDPLRRWSAATPDAPAAETAALFAFLNGGKASMTGTGATRADELMAWADVILGDGETAALTNGLRRPDTSVVAIESLGGDGPLAGMPASEFTLQAWCGLMSGCGTVATPPLQMGIAPRPVGHRRTGGAGRARRPPVRRPHRYGVGGGGQRARGDGRLPEQLPRRCTDSSPARCRSCRGAATGPRSSAARTVGSVSACSPPQQWADFAAMIGRDDLSGDDRLNSMGGRARNRELAESVVRPWLETHTPAEICELGELFRVPVALVGNGRDVLAMDHFVEREVFVERPEGFLAPRSPFLMSASPVRPVAPRPGWVPTTATRRGETPNRSRAPQASRAGGDLPLTGVTVLDLTAFWAGPAATHHLATLGADVLKIESPTRPDGMRFATVKPPTDPDWMEFGPTFHGTNPAKRSVTIDFSTPEGRELVLRLVEQTDVVVENFTPRVLGNVGLEYHDLFARNPDVILLRMPAFGLDGPWRDRSGFAQTTEQVSGIAWMTGEAGGEALVRSTIDPIAGIHGAFVVLAALEHRDRTGEGQMIEMPMAEVALNVAAEPIVTWSAYGTLLERAGNRGAGGGAAGRLRVRGARAVGGTVDHRRRRVARARAGPGRAGLGDATPRSPPARGVAPRTTASTPRWPRGSPGATATTPWTRCSPPGCRPRRCGTR